MKLDLIQMSLRPHWHILIKMNFGEHATVQHIFKKELN